MENLIILKDLTKLFQVHQREKGGLVAAFQSLFKRNFQTVVAVDHINLKVQEGEIRALLGPNGAGKSTTVKMLSGILYPTEGEISVMGYIPWKQRVEYVKNIGVLFGQKGQLIWELPAIDTFLIYKEIYRIPRIEFAQNLDYLVELFQIGDLIKKPVRNLSLGERMKCEFICTILHQPKLVFLDEPTIGMDVIAKEIVLEYIKKLNRERGVTFIVTSHDLSEIASLCRKITIINHGRVVLDDTMENIKTEFGGKKVVTLNFSREPALQEIRKFNIEMTGPCTGNIEFDHRNGGMQQAFIRLMQQLPVQDFNVAENNIEAIIRKIYRSKARNGALE